MSFGGMLYYDTQAQNAFWTAAPSSDLSMLCRIIATFEHHCSRTFVE